MGAGREAGPLFYFTQIGQSWVGAKKNPGHPAGVPDPSATESSAKPPGLARRRVGATPQDTIRLDAGATSKKILNFFLKIAGWLKSHPDARKNATARVIMDPSGKRLAISGPGQMAGYPKSPADLAHYTKSLQIGSPKLTDGDIDVLHQKLKQYGK